MSGIPEQRLQRQQLSAPRFTTPAEVVGWLGAVQAQDYAATKWAVGLRLPSGTATESSVEQSLTDGTVLRTHLQRGTWQLVVPRDLRWMAALFAPRLLARNATRHRQLGLEEATFRRCNQTLRRALRDGPALTRAEVVRLLEQAGIDSSGQRLPYLLQRAELDAVICSGPRQGKQFTYDLVDRRAPLPGLELTREEALAELVRRYFRSRGPATVDDFCWWSGLTVAEARQGLEAARSDLESEGSGKQTSWQGEPEKTPPNREAYLLPAFDEYLVGYRDRSGVLDPEQALRINDRGGMLSPSVVVNGQVIGTWRRELSRDEVSVELRPFHPLTAAQSKLLDAAVRRYGAFLELEPRWTLGATPPRPPAG